MKRIITCSDGTWNKPDAHSGSQTSATNVQKIFSVIAKSGQQNGTEIPQIKYYDEGIGNRGNAISKLVNGAIGAGIDDNIKDVYKFIVWNYQPGDELYLFGFSRGAYTARSLVGLIRNCGILRDNNLALIDEAYQIYRDRNDPRKGPNGAGAKAFRDQYCHPEATVKFIGVWDTVGALGIPLHFLSFVDGRKYAFHDTALSGIVQNACHALAIDERRASFTPTLWTLDADPLKRPANQHMRQLWFAGVHSNIGGGYPDTGLSDITLQWMANQARACGLALDEDVLAALLHPDVQGKIYNSKTGIFELAAEYLRPVMQTVLGNEGIHPSVWDRMEGMDYAPENVDINFAQTSSPVYTNLA